MSDPMYPPPPPPSMPPPSMGSGMASQQVQGPALGLMITAGLAILFTLLSVVMNIAGVGMQGLGDMGGMGGNDAAAQYMTYMSGGVGIALNLVGLAIYGFVLWGAMQMKQLRKWNIALGASIGAMLPCSCCCIIGLPIGIWSLIVLMKPEVKSAFVG
jgi:hypothetical protein